MTSGPNQARRRFSSQGQILPNQSLSRYAIMHFVAMATTLVRGDQSDSPTIIWTEKITSPDCRDMDLRTLSGPQQNYLSRKYDFSGLQKFAESLENTFRTTENLFRSNR